MLSGYLRSVFGDFSRSSRELSVGVRSVTEAFEDLVGSQYDTEEPKRFQGFSKPFQEVSEDFKRVSLTYCGIWEGP